MKPIDLPIEFSTLMLKNKLSIELSTNQLKKENRIFKKIYFFFLTISIIRIKSKRLLLNLVFQFQ